MRTNKFLKLIDENNLPVYLKIDEINYVEVEKYMGKPMIKVRLERKYSKFFSLDQLNHLDQQLEYPEVALP